jgi:hypothetical protein
MKDKLRQAPPPGEPAGHETTDISIRGVTGFLIGLGIVLVLTGLSLWWFFEQMESYARSGDKSPSPVARDKVLPKLPVKLQETPRADMQALREAEHKRLSAYGWIDQKEKIVHIPISEAIDHAARDGLPRWPAVEPRPQEDRQP